MKVLPLFVATAVLALDLGVAQAGSVVGSAPLFVGDLATYDCAVVNAGEKEIASVTVHVSINGGNLGSGTTTTCAPLAPHAVCTATNQAGSTAWRFCSLEVTGSAKALRGQFCNMSECTPLR